MDFMFDWEAEGDRFSFEDSDRFEEDSLCSWISEPESLCNNWRGWRKNQNGGQSQLVSINIPFPSTSGGKQEVTPLLELASQAVASQIPFEVVEHFPEPIPEQLQLRIAFWSFPENEEDIRLYSCLANGSADEFQKGEHLFKAKAVKDALQIGFHLSATVIPPQSVAQAKGTFSVAVVFDRRRITSCNCTCNCTASWCAHVVALCLFRIHQAPNVCLRAPVSESLSRLQRDQLQKFAQYLISELPQQILPTAQRLLDELLSSQQTAINTVCGAPDPTAGPSASEQTTWCLDETTLHENIKKTLIKFCVPSPIVFSDVNYLSSTAPPAAAEWQSLLRPLRGREPEGMWNLLSIVREMFRRNDSNAVPLLQILTEEVLSCEQILIWWFNTKISASHNSANGHNMRSQQNSSSSSQHAASSMCDEIVTLWRLAALNPALSSIQRDDLATQLKDWHIKTIDKVRKGRSANMSATNSNIKKADIEIFSGFKASIEACQLDWKDYPIPGLTYQENEYNLRWKFSFGKINDGEGRKGGRGKTHTIAQASTTGVQHKIGGGLMGAMLPSQRHMQRQQQHSRQNHTSDLDPSSAHTDGACSSSSEGFCENDRLDDKNPHDSDSDFNEIGDPHHKHKQIPKFGNHQSLDHAFSSNSAAAPSGGSSYHDQLHKKESKLASSSASKLENASSIPSHVTNTNSQAQGLGAAKLAAVHRFPSEDLDSDSSAAGGASAPPPVLPGTSSGKQGTSNSSLVGGGVTTVTAAGAAAHPLPAPAPIGTFNLPNADESHQSSDEYQVYFFDPKLKLPEPAAEKKKKTDEPNYFAGMRKLENKQDILFARAEGLHAHGHTREACKLARRLAEEILTNPPDFTSENHHHSGKGKKKKAQTNIGSFASTTLAKVGFLCSVLLEDVECHHLAFQIGMFGLEMPRPPASSKALEVKLAHQESELANLLKKIPLGNAELCVIRDRAEQLRDGKLKSRGEALLPLTLASFIFDSLCLPVCPVSGNNSRPPSRCVQNSARLPTDEKLGFEAAVAALGLKANVSEAEHPLLCEGTRRQRGDLAIAMLVHYKDDQKKLSMIMDKILDKEVHQLFKAPSLSTYLASCPNNSKSAQNRQVLPKPMLTNMVQGSAAGAASVMSGNESRDRTVNGIRMPPDSLILYHQDQAAAQATSGTATSTNAGDIQLVRGEVNLPAPPPQQEDPPLDVVVEVSQAADHRLDYLDLESSVAHMSINNTTSSNASTSTGARPKTALLKSYNSKDTDSSAVEEDIDNPDYKAWEAKFRCTNLKTVKKHSVGMAAIDSSAPETTSSDNSPTLVRRNWSKHQGPGSDSGSSGKSSDSFGSSSSGDKGAAMKVRDDSPLGVYGAVRFAPHLIVDSRSSTPNMKASRYKGKNRAMPTVPNQPSEASAHFMFELAKTVLNKAGGNSSTSLFTQATTNNNHTGPHRNLHFCAFQIGLYALGLHNCVSPNWLSRTYSSHVSWITGQAMEIGSAAINSLIDTWEGHLTPPEVASLADRASRGRDPNMVRAAAELALSCLPHAQALNPTEIQRALIQCKEQSRDMLERASLAVESAAKGGGVYPEVLFDVAKRWYELYEESTQAAQAGGQAAVASTSAQTASQALAISAESLVTQALVPVTPAQQVVLDNNSTVMQLVPCQQIQSVQPGINPAAPLQQGANGSVQPQAGQMPAAAAVAVPPIPYTIPPAANHPQLPHHPYMQSYSYVQQIPPNFTLHYSQPHIPLHTHNMHPSYMATYPYNTNQQASFTNMPHIQNIHPNSATLYHANISHLRPPPPGALAVNYQTSQTAPIQGVQVRTGNASVPVVQQKFGILQPADVQQGNAVTQANLVVQQQVAATSQHQQGAAGGSGGSNGQQQQSDSLPAQNTPQMNYLLAAYRVGMLAMETLARRVHDDRPQTKYARNPPYGEDVRWLMGVSMKLGTTVLQQFCAAAVNAIVSPFVLQDIALEAAHYLTRNNPAQVTNQLRSPTLNSLVQKCVQMFSQCTHQRMHHITQAEYDEFVSIVCSARNAFCMTPGGMVQFNELLQSLRRSKSCKKDLWQRIVNALATGNI